MPGIARAVMDKAGGSLFPTQFSVKVNGYYAIRNGDSVFGHFPGPLMPWHMWASVKAQHRTGVYIEGKATVVAGDFATCGHDVGPGSPNVTAGKPKEGSFVGSVIKWQKGGYF